jgi:hypothetical protein
MRTIGNTIIRPTSVTIGTVEFGKRLSIRREQSKPNAETIMAKLAKYTLTHNEQKDRWDLERDKTGQVVKSFKTKERATKGGVLERAVGLAGGSVKIQKQNGKFQEERTYPGTRDPKKSPG